jgi:hypothetical protein
MPLTHLKFKLNLRECTGRRMWWLISASATLANRHSSKDQGMDGLDQMRTVAPKRALSPARWRSGYAEDCKSLHAGSIPARASILLIAHLFPAAQPVLA